jgi:eukaryotic-like serine/threonine-protein kinase
MLAFKPHRGAIFQTAFSPDGTAIATSGLNPVVCVSDAATGHPRWQRAAKARVIGLGLAYSPDGTRLAVVDWSEVTIFDARTGDVLHKHPGRGYAVAFTPDGSGVVTGNVRAESDAIRTNVRTGRSRRISALRGTTTFNRFQYSPDGRFLAALGDSTVDLIEAETWKGGTEATLSHPTGGVGALTWHPAARVIVYSDGPKLIAYSWESRWPIAERVRSKKYIQDAAFTPDGRHLITVSNETTAVLWETAKWTEVREFVWDIGPLKSVAIAPDGARAVCASDRGRVVVWDLDV